MKSGNLKSGFILSYAAIFIQILINIIYTPVLLRLLGQSNYGLLQLAISTISNLTVLSFGFGSSYLRFYSEYKADNNTHSISVLNGMFVMIFLSASILALAVGGVIVFNADNFFTSISDGQIQTLKILLAAAIVNLALSFPCNVFDSYIISQERFSFQKILLIISSLLTPLLTLPMLILGKGVVSVMVCMCIVTAVKLLTSMFYCIKKLKMKFSFSFDTAVFKQLIIFSFFIFLNIISDRLNWSVDQILLGVFKGADSVATYSIGSQFNTYFLTFSYAFLSLSTPKAYTLTNSKVSNSKLSDFFANFGRIQFSIMAYLYLIFIAIGKPFIRLWSGIDSDIPYYTALFLLSPLLLTSIQSIGIEIQRAKDMHRFRSVVYILIALFNVLLSIPLCKAYGEIGCAIATGLCLLIGNVLIMNVYYHKHVGLNVIHFWFEIFKFIPSLILPLVSVFLIRHFIGSNILSLCIGGAIFTVVYILSIWFIGFNPKEKEKIISHKS